MPPAGTPELKPSALVAVVGRANAGKSTLVNALVGEKVSIVSPVAQTTRALVRAILTEPRGQLVFLDTPGVHRATYDLGKVMNRTARASVEGADMVLLVVDAAQPPREEDLGWIRRLGKEAVPVVAALNQCDRNTDHAAAFRAAWTGPAVPVWVEVSGLTGQGTGALLEALFRLAPPGPPLFPDDVVTDYPRKLIIADTVREKYFQVLKEELPHALAVEIESLEEGPGGWIAEGTVFVQKNSQKGIVLGAKGRLLKRVQAAAEKELADVYGRPVTLSLWVKVDPNWSRNYWMLKRLGYAE
ncbi:MAG TPA: GTPase Era [Kiritimatiellia bacterium]|nr:GTPase Era [Kiritimatiellia bacterium]HRZ10847.1 GTPase Era [Kiritimatiellia bacterium]HSA18880.1 GTPase Era [Kiritimatiellia bacterium]